MLCAAFGGARKIPISKCKGSLILKVLEEKDDEVTSGSLTCEACKTEYEIKEGIPILLNE